MFACEGIPYLTVLAVVRRKGFGHAISVEQDRTVIYTVMKEEQRAVAKLKREYV